MIKNKGLSFFILIVATIIWGSTFFIIRNNVMMIDLVTLLTYRFLIASVALGCYLTLFKRKRIFSHFKKGIFLGLPLFVFFFLQTLGLKYTTAVNSGFITSLLVIYIPILNFIIWRNLPTFGHTISMVIAVIGILFMTQGFSGLNKGDLFTLIGASCGAIHILLAEKFIQKFDVWILNFQQLFVVGSLSLLCIWLFKKPIIISSFFPLLSILYLSIAATIIAFGFQLFSQKHLSATTVSLILTLEPLFSAIFAWTLGRERFSLKIAISGLIIISAVLISELWSKKNIEKKKLIE